jgi:hypothetical protein
MTTSYNNNLRIAEIATGDQAGVWGNTTNYNLAVLLSQAISGYATVPVLSSAQALVSTDGTSDEARQAIIELTGTPGSNFNIYVPPADKIYVIKNSTTDVGLYTATIRVATARNGTTQSGLTEIAIPNGRTAIVVTKSTGTPSIYEGLNHIAGSLTVGGGIISVGNGLFGGTGGLTIPVGTTLQQAGGIGTIRYNTTLSRFEGYNGTEWGGIGGGGGSGGSGATGGGQNQVFYENEQAVTVSYTIPAATNAMTAGPITVNPGFEGTATISDGSISAGTVLNVLTRTAGTLYIGTIIEGTGVPANTTIVAFGTGTGETGTYTVSNSASLLSPFALTSTVEVTITSGSNWVVVG